MLRIMCMKPVPGLGEKWLEGKTWVAERPAKRVLSKAEPDEDERIEALGSLKWLM